MTEASRQIGGLGRLVKANRESTPPATVPGITPRDAAASTKAGSKKRASGPTPERSAPVSASADVGKQNVTVSIPAELRNRSRAAFRATQHLEDDESYSDFVSKAIDAEISRRETVHNNGNRYEGGDRALASGRPMAK